MLKVPMSASGMVRDSARSLNDGKRLERRPRRRILRLRGQATDLVKADEAKEEERRGGDHAGTGDEALFRDFPGGLRPFGPLRLRLVPFRGRCKSFFFPILSSRSKALWDVACCRGACREGQRPRRTRRSCVSEAHGMPLD